MFLIENEPHSNHPREMETVSSSVENKIDDDFAWAMSIMKRK